MKRRVAVLGMIMACMGIACAQDNRANNPQKDEVNRRDKLFFTLGLGFMDLQRNGPVISDGDELTRQLRSMLVELEAPRTLIARVEDLQEVYKVPAASRANMEALGMKSFNDEWEAYLKKEEPEARAYAFMGMSASLSVSYFSDQSSRLSNNAGDEDETGGNRDCESKDSSDCGGKGSNASDLFASLLASVDKECVPQAHCSLAMIDDFHQIAALLKANNQLVAKVMPIMRDLYDRALVAY